MVRLLSLILALVMIGSVLTACGEPKSTPDEAGTDSVEEVELTQINLTPDIEYIAQASKDFKISFAVDNGELADDISADDIYLTSSFKGMSAEVVSHSKNNLTLQLKGDIVPNAANAYQWGTVNVKASAFKDGEQDVASNVDIAFINGNFDATTLKYNDGKITVNYITYSSKADELSEDNIKIEGVTVEKVEKVDDNTVKLTLSADGVKDANSFAELFGGDEIEVNGLTSDIELSQASFYPVFDYVEENGKNLELTLKLCVYNGSVNKELKADAISLADGFADGKVESVTVDDDTTATVVISVPANGVSAADIDIEGTVTLAAGSLTNKWGEKTSWEQTFSRNYSNETLGRDKIASDDWVVLGSTNATLNGDTLLQIQKYTRGLNTTFGKICYYGGIAGQVFSIGKTILEATGALQSDQDKIMEQFSILSSKLDDVLENQYKIMDILNTIDKDVIESANEPYRINLDGLKAKVKLQEKLFWLGAMYMALEDAVAEGKLDKMPRQDDFDEYVDYLPNVDEMTDEEIEEYNNRLVDYMTMRSLNPTDPVFDDFKTSYDSLKDYLGIIADMLARTDATNPITRYDTLCSMKYNFDSQCYGFRFAQRATAADLLSRGMMIVFAHEKVMTYPKETTFINLQERVEKAATWLDKSYESLGHTATEVSEGYCTFSYVFGRYVYIKDTKSASTYESFGGAIQEDSKYRNWTNDEKREFMGRIQTSNVQDEFKSAGMTIDCPLLLTFGSKNHYVLNQTVQRWDLYYDYIGDIIETDKKTASNDVHIGANYTHVAKTKAKDMDVTYLILTDSDRNPEAISIDPDRKRIAYQAHVQDIGWQEPVISDISDWKTAGTTGKGKRMEALKIFLVDEDGSSMVQYRAYVQDKGWQDWVDSSTDRYAGTTGQGKRMEALEIKLKTEYTDEYMIYYRVYVQDTGWTDWVTNGSTAGTTGKSKRIEAVEIGLQEAPTITEWRPVI